MHSLLVTGLMLGAVLAEILFSGRMSDAVVQRLARVYDGARHPEMRLWLGYPAAILSSIGLVIWGIAVAEKWHWAAAQCGLVLCKCCSRVVAESRSYRVVPSRPGRK